MLPNVRPFLILAITLIAVAGPERLAFAQRPELPDTDPAKTWTDADSMDERWNDMEIGPFIASVIKVGEANVAKGLSIVVGDQGQRTVCFDTKTCAFRGAWSGGMVKFHPRRYGIVKPPEVDGELEITTPESSWGKAPVQYRGLYQHGRRVVLEYEVDGTLVQESPWVVEKDGIVAVTRSFNIAPHGDLLQLVLADDRDVTKSGGREGDIEWLEKNGQMQAFGAHRKHRSTAILRRRKEQRGDPPRETQGAMVINLPASEEHFEFTLFCYTGKREEMPAFAQLVKQQESVAALGKLRQPGEPLWPQASRVESKVGTGEGPYVVDRLGVPFENPYKALMFCTGVDFFQNGRMAVSTLHGDVWLVDGVDNDLKNVTWRRYATGLHQPLGLKIVDDLVYVLGKDQITRLYDRDRNGEADHYECFNNGGDTSLGGHDYAACLETDPQGNFYYIRAKQGVCKVSADGRTHEVVASGFRNPVGLGVGPQGMVTAAPQEGNWTPASCLFHVRDGGYYGYGGPRTSDARPLGYDPPLCWMPRSLDNSSGGQVWVTSDKWGPLKGQMLHLSYGMCALINVMHEEVEGVTQGGAVKFDLPQFSSGIMRGRFGPDGQLYLAGIMGWQTAAAEDGCIERVRYTGGKVHLPVRLNVKPDGLSLTFSEALDPKSAGNPDNYFIETWNYRYSKDYGSKEYRPSDPKKFGRDEVYIDDATVSEDGRTIHLQLEEITPVMQMAITYQLETPEGKPLKQTIYNTVHVVPER